MKKKVVIYIVIAVAVFLNLIIPACGSKNNSNPNPYLNNYSCTPGQQCNGVNGTPLFPGPVTTSVDAYGSAAMMNIYASNYTAGAPNGVVAVQMQVFISPGNGYGCPPGNYYLQGQGSWAPNYGGTYGLITAQLVGGNGFAVNLYGEVYGGQDPNQSQPTQYYYVGKFGNSCDPNATAL